MTEKDLRKTYYPNYFSIDNILACQTLIPCRTEMRLPKFGFLVPDCQAEDLPVGVNLQLPLWAARVLCKPTRKYMSVIIPPGFKEAHREVTEEKATRTDLTKIHEQYFEAGHLCTSLFHNDAGELAEMLPEVLQQRILCIGESTIPYPRPIWARKIYSTEAIPPELMELLELKIFHDADKGSKNVVKWLETIRNVPPRVVSSPASSSTSHSKTHASSPSPQQPHQQQRYTPEPNRPPSQQSHHHHSPLNVPQPPIQHPIITSSHHPYPINASTPPVAVPQTSYIPHTPQYVPMNMSLHSPIPVQVPHTMGGHTLTTNGGSFQQQQQQQQQNLPYQQQAHLHHQHLQHNPHHHHMMQ